MCLECKRGNVINEACRILLPSDRCSHDRYADCVQNQCFSYRQPEDLLHKRWHAGHPVAACRRLNCFPEDHSEDSAKESLLIPAGEGCAHREMAECWDNGCFHWTEHRGVCHHGNVFEPSSHWSEACANPQLTEHRHIDTMEDLRRRLSAREGCFRRVIDETKAWLNQGALPHRYDDAKLSERLLWDICLNDEFDEVEELQARKRAGVDPDGTLPVMYFDLQFNKQLAQRRPHGSKRKFSDASIYSDMEVEAET